LQAVVLASGSKTSSTKSGYDYAFYLFPTHPSSKKSGDSVLLLERLH